MIAKAMLLALVAVVLLGSAQPLGRHLRQTFCVVAAGLEPAATVLCVDRVP